MFCIKRRKDWALKRENSIKKAKKTENERRTQMQIKLTPAKLLTSNSLSTTERLSKNWEWEVKRLPPRNSTKSESRTRRLTSYSKIITNSLDPPPLLSHLKAKTSKKWLSARQPKTPISLDSSTQACLLKKLVNLQILSGKIANLPDLITSRDNWARLLSLAFSLSLQPFLFTRFLSNPRLCKPYFLLKIVMESKQLTEMSCSTLQIKTLNSWQTLKLLVNNPPAVYSVSARLRQLSATKFGKITLMETKTEMQSAKNTSRLPSKRSSG